MPLTTAENLAAECILILTPTARDAELSASFLNSAGLVAKPCRDVFDLSHKMSEGCGAIMLAEEAIGTSSVQVIAEKLSQQPSWSELPVIIITSGGESATARLRRLEI